MHLRIVNFDNQLLIVDLLSQYVDALAHTVVVLAQFLAQEEYGLYLSELLTYQQAVLNRIVAALAHDLFNQRYHMVGPYLAR